jgi:adenine-specific DNA-methyltransferase
MSKAAAEKTSKTETTQYDFAEQQRSAPDSAAALALSSPRRRRLVLGGATGDKPLQSQVEQARLRVSRATDATKKSQFGQFLTPARIAAFMAELFPREGGVCRLLDAGAGIGSLSAAFLERWQCRDLQFERVYLDAFELDASLHPHLAQTLSGYSREALQARIYGEDFVQAAVDALCGGLFSRPLQQYTHAILNPPYKKISSTSVHRLALRSVGIETVNLYSAFVALALALVSPQGKVVAIIPRSFCNGPYYRPFRNFILEHAAIRRLHLFESRRSAFKEDNVLQENVILLLERGGSQGSVLVSTSTDDTFADLVQFELTLGQVVSADDPERIIHIPTSLDKSAITLSSKISHDLAHLGLKVSTGPVVDFRLREHLRDMPVPGAVPLLYPCHFAGQGTTWPIEGMKKPNAIDRNAATEKWLYPRGFYCVVRRLSSKEEPRRIVASVVEPSKLGDAPMIGLENHLNLFHEDRRGLTEALARGLAVFLSTTAVDEHFRRFNGHTQVNAADLKLLKYPSREALIQLGTWAMRQGSLTQDLIDAQLEAMSE